MGGLRRTSEGTTLRHGVYIRAEEAGNLHVKNSHPVLWCIKSGNEV